MSLVCANLFAEVATGKIDFIQVSTYHDAVYFKLKNMPAKVTSGYFYIIPSSGDFGGCTSTAKKDTMDRAYSGLLMSYASSREIELNYCLDKNGYGLVTRILESNKDYYV